MTAKNAMSMTLKQEADSPTLYDESGRPVRAFFADTKRVLLVSPQNTEKVMEAKALAVNPHAFGIKDNQLAIVGRIYNQADLPNGRRVPDGNPAYIYHIREIELDDGKVFEIDKIFMDDKKLLVQGSVKKALVC